MRSGSRAPILMARAGTETCPTQRGAGNRRCCGPVPRWTPGISGCDGSRLSCQFVVTVQPRAWSADFAAAPVADGAADVPPLMFSVPFDRPAALIDTRMLSTLAWLNPQFWKLPVKFVAVQLSNTFAGNVVRDEQFSHAYAKSVPDDVSIAGNDTRDEQFSHAYEKFVPDDMFIAGNDTRDEQFSHDPLNNVPDDVFIAGNVVRDEQFCHAPLNNVPEDVFISGNVVRDEQPHHAYEKFVPDDVFIAGNVVRDEQAYHAFEKFVPDDVLIAGNDVINE